MLETCMKTSQIRLYSPLDEVIPMSTDFWRQFL